MTLTALEIEFSMVVIYLRPRLWQENDEFACR